VDWIYGIHAVQTMLKSAPQRVAELHVQSGRQDDRLQKIHNLADQHGITMSKLRESTKVLWLYAVPVKPMMKNFYWDWRKSRDLTPFS
jgi:hypothetical protein